MTSTLTGHGWFSTLRQFLRFGLVGGLNTIVDLLILNVLLWLFPTQHTSLLIIYNSIAYGIGTIDSFVLNKYWTFDHRKHTTPADGYNGLHRLLGTAFGSGNLPSSQASRTSPGSSPSSQQPSTVGGSGGGDGIFALIGTGGARIFRLFTQGMAGQISWLLPLALLGWLVAAWQTWRRAASRLPGNQQRQAIVLWGGWLLVMDGGDARITLNEIPAQIRATLPAQILRQLEQGDFSFADGLSGSNRNSALTTWITTHCRKVPASAWQSSSSGSRRSPAEGRRQQLYDCASRH